MNPFPYIVFILKNKKKTILDLLQESLEQQQTTNKKPCNVYKILFKKKRNGNFCKIQILNLHTENI